MALSRIVLSCLVLLNGVPRARGQQDDDPFKNAPPTKSPPGTILVPSALEDAATLLASEPALVNEAHEKVYLTYKSAVAQSDGEFAAREKSLATATAAALGKLKPSLDAASQRSIETAVAAVAKGDYGVLAPRDGDVATVAAVKRSQLGRHQRLRAAQGLAHAQAIRDYLAALEKLQAVLAKEGNLEDAVFVATEIRGLQRLLARGGTGGVALAAFHFRPVPATGPSTELPPLSSGIPILTSIGGDYSGAQTWIALRPPAPDGGPGKAWELRGGLVPEAAGGTVTLMEAPLIDFPGAEITTREWKGGGATPPTIKLIPAAEGFCMICGLRGPFESGTEAKIYINNSDQTWYLAGKGGDADTTVSIAVIRFPDPATRPVVATKSYSWIKGTPHLRLGESSQGFSAFSRIAGPLDGRSSSFSLVIAPDGFWYLQGRAEEATTAFDALSFTLKPADGS